VHQGNATATIFAGDAEVFTFSIHGANNYPLFKARSTLDVELEDGTPDTSYLSALAASLPAVLSHQPDIIFYLGGADPYVGDKLGRLSLSIAGLRKRDELVLQACYDRELPSSR
jgi:acetoin utilization deacetylase AcuC-like enzyme